MPTGNVKWFDVKKGFGFIVGPDGQDVFVHFSSIGGAGFKTLKDGEPVEYELNQGEKGFHARDVRRLNPRPDGEAGGDDTATAASPAAVGAADASPAVQGA